jgi:hypothetical protein
MDDDVIIILHAFRTSNRRKSRLGIHQKKKMTLTISSYHNQKTNTILDFILILYILNPNNQESSLYFIKITKKQSNAFL